MTCNQVRARELVEQYLSGQLAEDEATTFEMHYFDCERCFADLENARHVRQALSIKASSIRAEPLPPPKTWLLWLAPIAVAGALGVIVAMVLQHAPQGQQRVAQAPVAEAKDYTVLAQITAPEYSAPAFRSGESAADESFWVAMVEYSSRDYAAAIPKLKKALESGAKPIPALFYLGACYLLTDDYSSGAQTLQGVADAGPSDFREESRFLIAQAILKQNNPGAARLQLGLIAEGKGEFAAKAQTLLDAVNRLEYSR